MNWQHVWMLVQFEIKQMKFYFLLLIGILSFVFYVVLSSITLHLEEGNVSLDFMFIYFISLSVMFSRPKVFRSQKYQEDVWASHFLVMLQQLPCTRSLITTYRFVYYLVVVIPLQVIILLCLYVFSSSIQNTMSIGEYVAFILVWLCISVLLYWVIVIQDIGLMQNFISWIERLFYMFLIIVVYYGVFYGLYRYGFVIWTMQAVKSYPILSVIISIICATVGTILLKIYTEKRMTRFDYY